MTTPDGPGTALAVTMPDAPVATRGPDEAEQLLPLPAQTAHSLPRDVAARLARYAKRYRAAMAPATVRAVRGDWTTYATWCSNVGVSPLKGLRLPEELAAREQQEEHELEQLQAFLQNAVDRGLRRASLDRYLFTIRLAHRAARVPDPTQHPAWPLLWKALVRQLAKDNRNQKRPAQPLRKAVVAQVLPAPEASLRALRDAALMCLASDTGARRAEIARVRVEEIARIGDVGALTIPSSKTDQEGHGKVRHISAATMQHLDRWLTAAGIEAGPVFRAVHLRRPGKKRTTVGSAALVPVLSPRPIAPQQVARIFKQRLLEGGFDVRGISGHSARIGSTHDLVASGYTGTAIAQAFGWASEAMVNYYSRELLTQHSVMAQARADDPLPVPASSETPIEAGHGATGCEDRMPKK
jgi:integrase